MNNTLNHGTFNARLRQRQLRNSVEEKKSSLIPFLKSAVVRLVLYQASNIKEV